MLKARKENQVGKSSFIRVGVGDLIEVCFKPLSTIKDIDCAKVIRVQRRYGLVDQGTRHLSPLVTVIDLNTKGERTFDNEYVVRVIERVKKTPAPRNIFTEGVEEDSGFAFRLSVCSKKGVLCGPLHELAILFLSKINYPPLERGIDQLKLKKLFEKQMPGFLGFEQGCYTINKKAFGKWIRKNALKVCLTVAQIRVRDTRFERDYEDQYWKDVEDQYWKDVEDQYWKDVEDQYWKDVEED